MKKILSTVIVACALIASNSAFAQMKNAGQDAATNKGDVLFDFGIGLLGGSYDGFNYDHYGNAGYYGGNNYNNNYSNNIQIPTISLALQKAFWNDVTIGGQVAFNAFGSTKDLHQSDDYYQHYKYSQSNVFIMARGEYHFNRLIGLDPKYDFYAGALAGMRISGSRVTQNYEGWGTHGQAGSWRNDYADKTYSHVGPDGGLFAGFRYYFGKNIAVYGEVGWAITTFRAGLAWKL